MERKINSIGPKNGKRNVGQAKDHDRNITARGEKDIDNYDVRSKWEYI